MLEHLSVRDFALIDIAEVDFTPGFVVFSGETGAGKSLMVGAIGFLFGSRADTQVIREGANECAVSGVISISNNEEAKSWLKARDMEAEEGIVVIRRGLKASGRSYAYIQNQAVTRTDLSEFTALLADMHGQHEHQSLLESENHRSILDNFALMRGDLTEYRALYDSYVSLVKTYRQRLADAEKQARDTEMLNFEIQEIRQARIKEHEDEDLVAEEKILSQFEKLYAAIKGAAELLATSDSSALLPSIRKALGELLGAAQIDPRLKEYHDRLENAYYEMEDISQGLSAYIETIRFDPRRLEEVENRLSELKKLKKKYGPTLKEVLLRLENDCQRLEGFANWEQDKTKLEKAISELKPRVLAAAETLSEKRKKQGALLSRKVEKILAELGMPQARLSIAVEKMLSEQGKPILTPTGFDAVEFMIAPNQGESEKPLAKIASGGELSRIALALKSVLTAGDAIETLIFDEIDTGIGGEVAVAVSKYLKALAAQRQVLCVTHLASIAAKADTHFKVEKDVVDGRTLTRINLLKGQEREEEIARMLSGDSAGDYSRAHAAALLRNEQNSLGF